jgi:hypothetical protein
MSGRKMNGRGIAETTGKAMKVWLWSMVSWCLLIRLPYHDQILIRTGADDKRSGRLAAGSNRSLFTPNLSDGRLGGRTVCVGKTTRGESRAYEQDRDQVRSNPCGDKP